MKLRLRGFIGIKSGPKMDMTGPEEITVDFSGRDGIITFEGENGTGKSTIIESLHHYPCLISRSGPLWQHCCSREAEKEFESDFMGHHYRSLVKIDAQSHKQEGFLFVDGSAVSCCPASIKAYTEKVEEIFGKQETFFRARFAPQRSKKTAESQIENMKPGDFRDLLRQFLQIERYERHSQTAKQNANILQGKIEGMEGRIAGLMTAVEGQGKFYESLAENNQMEITLMEHHQGLRTEIDLKRKAIGPLRERINQNVVNAQRREDIQRQIDRLNGELDTEKADAEKAIADLAEKWRGIKAQIGPLDAVVRDREAAERAEESRKVAEEKAVALQGEIDGMTAEAGGHQKRVHELTLSLQEARQALRDLDNDPELVELDKAIEAATTTLRDLSKEIHDLEHDREVTRILGRIENATEKTAALERRDPSCTSTGCSFIVSALEAQDALKGLNVELTARKEVVEREVTYRRQNVTAKETEKRINERLREKWIAEQAGKKKTAADRIRTIEHDLRNAQQVEISSGELLTLKRKALAQARTEAETLRALASKLPSILVAVQQRADLERQLAEVAQAGTDRKKAWEAKAKEIDDAVQYHLGARAAYVIDTTVDAQLATLQAEIREIETVKIPAVEKEIQAARERIAGLRAELTRIEAAEKELEEVRKEKEGLAVQVSRWRYLQAVCGEKGIQALEIAGATPAIIGHANNLLMTAFDVPYTIHLRTLDDEGREVFQIKILCPDGREIDLDAISGGQRAWSVQPLLLGMSLLSQEKSGREFDYFCADESDGALDPENAARYAALYPAFMKVAGLKRLLFISHQPPARAMADHVLRFEAGKNPVWG